MTLNFKPGKVGAEIPVALLLSYAPPPSPGLRRRARAAYVMKEEDEDKKRRGRCSPRRSAGVVVRIPSLVHIQSAFIRHTSLSSPFLFACCIISDPCVWRVSW